MAYLPHLASLDTWFAAAQTSVPGVIPCKRGCTACCHGPFDISPADAALVAKGVAVLPDAERVALQQRAEVQRGLMAEFLPGWQTPWNLDDFDEEAVDIACEALAELPCPALGRDGACLIHVYRPATCRITGLGLITPEGDMLENVCPIQESFPVYRALPLYPFDLHGFEEISEDHDAAAAGDGWRRTTIAGAVAGAVARD